jgi:hypothetical protein
MKKIFAICLTVCMLSLCFSVSALAVEPGGSSSADIYILFEGEMIPKYSVDIDFGDMTFVYTANAEWNSELHDYTITPTEDSVWTPEREDGNRIVIVNHSDLPVAYRTTFENISDRFGELSLDAIGGDGQLAACPRHAAFAEAPSGSVTVSLDGIPKNLTGEKVILARVTVTISAV